MSKELIEFDSDPYSLFLFAINSPLTKEKYVPRLNKFFDFINLQGTIQEKCKPFVEKSRDETSWVVGCVIKFLQMNKERVERKEITAATALNYVKTIKLFCKQLEIPLPWKRITSGLPRGGRYADDRIPNLEEMMITHHLCASIVFSLVLILPLPSAHIALCPQMILLTTFVFVQLRTTLVILF